MSLPFDLYRLTEDIKGIADGLQEKDPDALQIQVSVIEAKIFSFQGCVEIRPVLREVPFGLILILQLPQRAAEFVGEGAKILLLKADCQNGLAFALDHHRVRNAHQILPTLACRVFQECADEVSTLPYLIGKDAVTLIGKGVPDERVDYLLGHGV
ncbi:hypothetical protein SDC9_76619 [bioreactor metagenome]|uniref:Uncharacterized protein n=1 Tax=bioreactor metagenome TaxID=1076179 RepID=A0A644YP78_9ZZZZ